MLKKIIATNAKVLNKLKKNKTGNLSLTNGELKVANELFKHTEQAFKSLSTLFLDCKSTVTVESLTNLQTLEGLTLINTWELREIPKSIDLLKSLKTLKIINRNFQSLITQLPDEIGNLSQLEELTLDSLVMLQKLPSTLSKLSRLKKLDISFAYHLKLLPTNIGSLKGLEALRLYQCAVLELPISYQELDNLKSLDIQFNDYNIRERQVSFKNISEGLSKNISTIYLRNTNLLQMPKDIERYQQLVSLKIFNSKKLTALPEEIVTIKCLKELSIVSCYLQTLPTYISKLIHLKTLDVSGNALTQLTEDFGKLTALELLNLESNPIEMLPESFGDLQKLKLAILRSLKIETLPESFSKLKTIQELFLTNNFKLRTLPDMSQLCALDALDLSYCPELSREDKDTVKKALPNTKIGTLEYI